MVRVTITIPYHDGLRTSCAVHSSALKLRLKCSNLLDISDLQVTSGFGFVSNDTRNHNSLGLEPNQFSLTLRGDSTLRFYRNLDLESCLWEFDGYFDMSELVSVCGGEISTDGQVSVQDCLFTPFQSELKCDKKKKNDQNTYNRKISMKY
ncbi:extracellular matrix protein 3-like [Mizuhopecten yessoensis]|uniref:extracellular matrix protein 3-like n=1 Tax=Mizuhopecten yessoensis TaxID=6573 RepID=UPI000B45CCBA|nr:extracellular matrix protein 3-like [Mizuhopecten yessoensis]